MVGVRGWGGDGSGRAFYFFPFPVQEENEGVMMYTWRKVELQTCEKTAPIFLPVSRRHC